MGCAESVEGVEGAVVRLLLYIQSLAINVLCYVCQ